MEALCKAKRLTGLVIDGCHQHGAQPNLKRRKSAILLALRGRHSRAARRQFFQKNEQVLEIPAADKKLVSVFLEVRYIHLGTVLRRDGCMLPEAKLRLGALEPYNLQIYSY